GTIRLKHRHVTSHDKKAQRSDRRWPRPNVVVHVANTLTKVANLSPLGETEWPLTIDAKASTYHVTGRVAHCSPARDAEGLWVVGFAFVNLSQDISDALQRYLRSQAEAARENDPRS